MNFDAKKLVKYLLEGSAVALAAFYIPRKKVDPMEIALIALTAAAIFMVLDFFAPAVAGGARTGAGFGIGYGLVGGADTKSEPETESDASTADSEPEPFDQGPQGEGFASVMN